MEVFPFLWLCSRDRLARLLAWGVVLFLGSLWLCFFAIGCGGRRNYHDVAFALSLPLAFVLHVGVKAVVALEAGRRFSEDRHSGALELLLVTPLSPRWIAYDQWEALRRHFRGPLLALLTVNAVLFWSLVIVNPMRLPSEARWFVGQALLLGAVALWVDFHALCWVGMLQGLRWRRHNRGVLVTLARVLLVPWLGVVLFILVGAAGRGVRDNELPGYALVWFLIGFGISLIQAFWVRNELPGRLRQWVSDDRGPATGPAASVTASAMTGSGVIAPRSAA
jgi:hypothetical protein